MSYVGKGLKSLLGSAVGVTNIVGAGTGIYPLTIPQGKDFPAVVYTVISEIPEDTKTSYGDLDVARVQIDCLATSYEEAEDLHLAVRAALDRQPGTYDGVVFDGVGKDLTRPDFDEILKVYSFSTDYFIRIKN